MVKLTKTTRKIVFNRLLVSLGIILIIRMGTFLPIPELNHTVLASYLQKHSAAKNLVSTFSGNDTFVIGLFTLNIFPYINATILIQLLLSFSPKLSQLQKDGDLAARRYINQLTRSITLFWAITQSVGISLYLRQVLLNWNFSLALEIILWLTTGAMVVLWLSERITEDGLGNGTSLLVYINIVSNLPNILKRTILTNSEHLTFFSSFLTFFVIFLSFYGIVFLQEGIRKIPLLSSRQLNQFSASRKPNAYIPLKFNQAGVMPIILTTTALVIPNYLISAGIFPWLNFLIAFKSIYWLIYLMLILAFSSFYSSIVLNPKDIADQLQKLAVTIPGLRPGLQTTLYLKRVIQRITLIGAILLAFLIIIPNFVESTLNVNGLSGLGATSLIILAGVILDLSREINNIYFANIYNNLY